MIVPAFGIVSHILSTYSKKPVFGSQSMIYAMASIGLLGFLVWSQMMAFPISDYWVINITICWNGVYLLTTFYSLNVNILSQSAGNFNKGSSETTRDNAYDLFFYYFNIIYKNYSDVDINWLNWFVGFSEGDGAILCYNSQPRFVLTQKDINILYDIQKKLNFGKVIVYKKNNKILYGRYIVSDLKNCILLYLIFNGNLCMKHRIKQLNYWYEVLKNSTIINRLPNLVLNNKTISLKDAWLSGFTDAEGCFNINKYKHRGIVYYQSRFILDQKDEWLLNNISQLLVNKNLTKLRSNHSDYRIAISCNDRYNNKKILDYFSEFSLKTTKYKSYLIFKSILELIIDDKFSEENIIKIDELRKQMNKHILENKSIGHKNKS